MWDRYIRGERPKKKYIKLNLLYKKYKTTAEGYIEFLKDMQIRYRAVKSGYHNRTLAKCIDENNFVMYTLPIRKLERRIVQI